MHPAKVRLKNGPSAPITLLSMKLAALVMGLICAEGLIADQALTDHDVVRMVHAGVAQDILLQLIADSPVQFGLQPDQLIGLKRAGVPDDVVRAMAAREREVRSIRYVPFSSEVRVVPAKRAKSKRRSWTRLKIW